MSDKKFTRKLKYDEPGENEEHIINIITEENAIKFQKEKLKKLGYVYMDDQMALDDFIAVNWASYLEE